MRYTIFLILILLAGVSIAQDTSGIVLESQEEIELHVPENNHEEVINAEVITEYREYRRYDYLANLDSLLRSRNRNSNKITIPDIGRKSVFDTPWFLYPAIIIVISFLSYFIFRIFKAQTGGLGKRTIPLSVSEHEEDSMKASYGNIAVALQNHDYRLAVRIRFLELLDKLNEKGVLESSPGKSNRDYIREINQEIRYDFKRIVLAYEYAWYGKRPVSAEQYQELAVEFDKIQTKISGR